MGEAIERKIENSMFLVISGTKLCLDPTYHTWLQSASIDGHFDTHKGGVWQHFFLLSLQWPQTCGGQRLGMAGSWRLGMMKMVFYRCQAIHISCPLQIAKNIAIWPHLINMSNMLKSVK